MNDCDVTELADVAWLFSKVVVGGGIKVEFFYMTTFSEISGGISVSRRRKGTRKRFVWY